MALAMVAGLGTARAADALASPGIVTLSGIQAHGVAIDPDRDIAYVTGTATSGPAAGTVSVVNLAAHTVTATIPVGVKPGKIAFDVYTDNLYLVNGYPDDTISVINGRTNTVTATIRFGVGVIPNAIAMDPDTDMVYVGVWGLATGVIVINGATNGIEAAFTNNALCGSATAAAYDSSTHRVYVTFSGLNCQRMFVLYGPTWSPIGSVPLPGDPEAITVDPAAGAFYIAYLSGALVRYSSANDAATGTVTVPAASSVVVNQGTHVVYAAPSQPGAGAIQLVNPAATKVTGSFSVPGSGWLALEPTTGALVYATSGTPDSTVSVIDPAAPKIASPARATFTVGRAGSFKVQVQGSPAPQLSEQGRLPAGVALIADGTLRGTPRAGTAGIYSVTFTAAANGIGPAATQRFTLTVDAPPALISAARATFKAGVRATFTIRTAGFPVAAVTERGTLPSGLRFTALRNGEAIITGTPAASARGKTYMLSLTARNGVSPVATQRFALYVY